MYTQTRPMSRFLDVRVVVGDVRVEDGFQRARLVDEAIRRHGRGDAEGRRREDGRVELREQAIVTLVIQDSVLIDASEEPVLPMMVDIAEPRPTPLLSLNPELASAEPTVKLTMPVLPADSANAEVALLPPMIDPDMRLDVASYSERAGLPAGVVATVIGTTGGNALTIKVDGETAVAMAVGELQAVWSHALEDALASPVRA